MKPTCRMLHVEDSADDAELVRFALRSAPFEAEVSRVETEAEFLEQLGGPLPDVVICDYDLPRFSASRALELLRQRSEATPFILVSHHIGRGEAVIAMQQGAWDYQPKGDLGRLPKAIEAALERARALREKAEAVAALRRSEATLRAILDSLSERIALLDANGIVLAANKAWRDLDIERARHGLQEMHHGANYLDMLEEIATRYDTRGREFATGIRSVISGDEPSYAFEYELPSPSGKRWYSARALPLEGVEHGVVVSHHDITERLMSHFALENAHRQLQGLSRRVLNIQEEERRAISSELHDDIGQSLGALKMGLHRIAGDPGAENSSLLRECIDIADSTLARLRRIAHDLRPPQLDQLGLQEALAWLAERQRTATGLEIQCQFAGLEKRLPTALESACYRITQEALSNAARHANAKSITVSAESDGRLLKLIVHDDGVGFEEEAARGGAARQGSMGLISMEERARLAGGRLKLRAVLGGGTTVTAIFPLGGHDAEPDSAPVHPE